MGHRSPLLPALLLLVPLALPGCDDDPVAADAGPTADSRSDQAAIDQQLQPDLAADTAVTDGEADTTTADAASGDAAADAAAGDVAPTDLFSDDASTSGTLAVLTYNVAGLPLGLSKSDPYTNTPLISPLLNAYALALMQEDFAFTTQLASQALHPYKSTPGTPALGTFMNDGLTRFSNYKFTGHTRVKWTACNGIADQGSDCLASKGFSVAVTALGPGVEVDVYNLHMDAGNSTGDLTARAAQVDQLLLEIASRSAGRAIIVAGDTNINPSKNVENAQMLAKLLQQAQLTDACVHTACGETDRIDRVMYRSSAAVKLEALSWQIDPSFVDSAGDPLSDHEAVGVLMSWGAVSPDGG